MISPQNGANAAPSRRPQHNPEVKTAAHKHVRGSGSGAGAVLVPIPGASC